MQPKFDRCMTELLSCKLEGQMRRFRFTTRSLLIFGIFVAVLAQLTFVSISLGPVYYRRYKFGGDYENLKSASASWKRIEGKAEGFEIQAENGVLLAVWTCPSRSDNLYSPSQVTDYSPDPKRFFVIPPGVWVDSIDEVLMHWDQYD